MLEPFLSSISLWLLLKFVALAGYTFLGVALLRLRAELANFLVVSSVICALYVFAMTGLLLPGYWLLLIGGWIAFASAAGLALRRPGIAGDFLTPGWVSYQACVLYYSYLVCDTVPAYWDEFAYWGLSAKEMLQTNALLGHSALSQHLDYPPGPQLMAYFVTKAVRSYEQGFYTSHFLIGASALWTLSANVRWKDVYWTPFLAAICFYLYASFNRAPANLQVEVLLGAYLGAAISSYFLGPLRGFKLLALAPALFALSLIKPFGLLFALLAATLIGLHGAMERILSPSTRVQADRSSHAGGSARDNDGRIVHDAEIPHRRGFRAPAWLMAGARLVPILALFAAPVAAKISWEVRVARLGVEKEFPVAGITYEKVREAFSSEAAWYQRRIRPAFWDKFDTARIGSSARARVKLDTVGWMIVITSIMALGTLLSWRGIATRSAVVAYLCLGAGLAAYLLCLLVFYLLVYDYRFALPMASYPRHVGAYLCGFLMVAIAFLTLNPVWDRELKVRIGKCLALALAVLALNAWAPPKGGIYKPYYSNRGRRGDAWKLRELSEGIREHVSQGDRVDFLHFGDDGFKQIIFRYFSYPIRVVNTPPSVTTKSLNNRYFSHLSVEDLGRRLNQADFLFLSGTTPDAIREYSAVLGRLAKGGDISVGLYEILRTGDDKPPWLVALSAGGKD